MTKKITLAAMLATALGAYAGPVEPTTISDGKFADNTQWYTMQIAAAGFYLTDAEEGGAMPLSKTSSLQTDGDLWCFVGNDTDGYMIYNRATGTEKSLAASSTPAGSDQGGSAFATLKAPGQEGQCYLWNFQSSTNITNSYYIYEQGLNGNKNKLNNRGNRLAFWTAGADAGSSVVITPHTPTAMTLGTDGVLTVSTDPTITLSGDVALTANADGSYTLGDCVYTFGSPDDYVVREYMIRFADGTSQSGVGRGESNAELPIQGPATITDVRVLAYPALQMAENGYAVFRYDKTPGFTIPYRIPTIVTINAGEHKGRLIAINDYRYCGGDIGAGRIDLYMSYSDDNGKTWSIPEVMRNAEGNPVAMGTGAGTPAGTKQSVTNLDCGFGDPASVSDRETGELLVVACCGRMNFFSSRRDDPQPSARWWSTDGGMTWTEPDYGQWEQIYALFDGTCRNGYIDGQFVGSGRMIQSSRVKVGSHYRVYCVMSGRHAESGNISNWVLYSDDFGHNWHVLGDPMNPAVSSGADEPKCEELPDGSILLAARGNGGGRNFNIFRYTDIAKAEGVWGSHINTNLGLDHGINACNGEIMILPVKNTTTGQQAYMAIQSFPNSTRREKVSLAWKILASAADYDEPSDFTRWDGFFQLSDKSSCYSTFTWQADNTLGIMFEESSFGDLGGGYCEIYRSLSIPELTDGAWEYCPDEDNTVARAHTDELVTLRANDVAGAPGNVVGNFIDKGKELVKNAADAYRANPSDETYAAFNAAISNTDYMLMPAHGGIYSFRNAHGGLAGYPTTDRWLGAATAALNLQSAENDATRFTVILPEDSENFILYSASAKRFVKATTEKTSTAISVSAVPEEAGQYTFNVKNGKVAIVCANPGHNSYPAIHMDSGTKPVIWTVDAAASQWVMTLLDTTNEFPELSGIEEVTAPEATSGSERYFDLQGRRVVSPRNGQLLITDTRKKVIKN